MYVYKHIYVYKRPWLVMCYSLLTPWGQVQMAAFGKRYFQVHFHDTKYCYFDSYLTNVCSHVSNYQKSVINSDDGLAPNKQQAIIWTNDSRLVYWHIYVSVELSELILYMYGQHWNNSNVPCDHIMWLQCNCYWTIAGSTRPPQIINAYIFEQVTWFSQPFKYCMNSIS